MLFKAIRYLTITVFQLMTILEGLLIINKVTNIFSIYKTFNTYHYEYTKQHPDDAIHETHRHG